MGLQEPLEWLLVWGGAVKDAHAVGSSRGLTRQHISMLVQRQQPCDDAGNHTALAPRGYLQPG